MYRVYRVPGTEVPGSGIFQKPKLPVEYRVYWQNSSSYIVPTSRTGTGRSNQSIVSPAKQ